MAAVGGHPQTDVLHRAIESYRRALGHWVPEEELLAGEFLFIAAETLSRFLVESRAAAKGITPKNLARAVQTDPEGLRAGYLRDEIFGSDEDALDAMRDASNGFEHGYVSVNDVRGLMDGVLERSMGLVRRALITATGVSGPLRDRLLDSRYETPRGLVPAIRIIKGTVGAVDPSNPALLDVGAIDLDWARSAPIATTNADGGVEFTFDTNIKATALPAGVTLEIDTYGLRAAHVKPVGEVATEVERASGADASEEPGR
jgi:hypothetical protein